MRHQRGQVLEPLAERRQPDGEDVEAEEQVLAKLAVGHRVLQPAVGGGHGADVDPQGALRAQALQVAGLERAEELGLRVGAQVADLVEEEGARVRQLEPAQPALRGPGEGTALVAEHLRFHQIARDGGAVDGHERAAGAPARGMDRRRRQLLSGAALPCEEHPRLGRPHPGDERPHLLHRRALAHERRAPPQLRVQRAILRPRPVELERGAHGHQHRLGGERLLQELEGAELDRAHRVGELGLAAHHDDRRAPAALAQADQRLQPVGTRRHEQVEEDDVGIDLLELEQRGVAVGRLRHGEPLLAEQRGQHPPDVGLVIHQEDLGPRRHTPRIRTTKVAPPPGVGSTLMAPRCISTVCFASASPRPVPPLLPVT